MLDSNFYGLGDFIHRYNFEDKKDNIRYYTLYMINRIMKMFKYKNLPDTIPKKMLELYMMVNGHSVVVKHNDALYVCFGGFSGEPDEYYVPRQYIVANPYLELFKTFTIDVDCVLMQNDTMMIGLMPMFSRYATSLVENDLTMDLITINSRISALIDAKDDATKASAEKFLSDLRDGKQGVIASNGFFDGIRAQPYSTNTDNRITNAIEYHQYLKASWYNEIGLNANYNMKRESIMSDESQLNDDMLLPLIDDMLECRVNSLNKINDMFGTNISVDFDSTWKDNQQELMLEQQQLQLDTIGGDNENIIEDEGTISNDDIG